MWNLSMRDPIQKNGFQKGSTSFAHHSNSANAQFVKGGQGQNSKRKSDYCWNFNKGVPCKFGSKCKFIERCKYCESLSHGVNDCTKLQKKAEFNTRPVQESGSKSAASSS